MSLFCNHKLVGLLAIAAFCFGCAEQSNDDDSLVDSRYFSGGETTVFNATSQAFSQPAPNLTDMAKHLEGDAGFESVFVKAPASVNPGLGPIYNHNSCVACHVGDGRGVVMSGEQSESPLFLKISLPGENSETGAPIPVPGFGTQLATASVFGTPREAHLQVSYSEISGEFSDGTPYSLRQPVYQIENPYQAIPGGILTSPRMSPPVFGRGLLEAVSDATLLAMSDENDVDGDGISGKVNLVWDYVASQTKVGRFGWKANNPTLLQQVAGAYHQDMGLTTPVFPDENCEGQTQCDSLNDDPEVSQEILEQVAFYVQTLGVPARRDIFNSEIQRGEQIFRAAKCSACHSPDLQTGNHLLAEVSNQSIHPYSDLLLHDMGEGLADHRQDYLADGREWKTPPLWGIGLTRVVQGNTHFLHDGRARTLMEAILWHGGEAEFSQTYVKNLSASDRDALIRFLESL